MGLDKGSGQATEQHGHQPSVRPECPGMRVGFSKVEHILEKCSNVRAGSVDLCISVSPALSRCLVQAVAWDTFIEQ